jgi:hypothetical protein
MRGGAQAHLIEADDGAFYIVKFVNNPQHRRILVNEAIASAILSHLQISAPQSRIVSLSPAFLAENPDVGIQLGTRKVAAEPGWHFGSRHPGNPQTMAIYDFIPDALLSQVANSDQFRAVLVFDRWVANADGRQSVFFRAQLNDWLAHPGVPPRKMGFLVSMIDHGFAFNGPHWDLPDSAITGLYPRRMVYETVQSLDDFEPWLSRVRNFPEDIISRALGQLPPQWVATDEPALNKLMEALLRRRKRIPELIQECRNSPGNPFPRWK